MCNGLLPSGEDRNSNKQMTSESHPQTKLWPQSCLVSNLVVAIRNLRFIAGLIVTRTRKTDSHQTFTVIAVVKIYSGMEIYWSEGFKSVPVDKRFFRQWMCK